LLAEMAIDMKRLGIQRHVGKQHVVHLSHRPVVAVLKNFAGHEIVEVDASTLGAMARCSLGHGRSPFNRATRRSGLQPRKPDMPDSGVETHWQVPSRTFPTAQVTPRSPARWLSDVWT